MNPIITIGITCYNEGDWLLECWNSVLAQSDDRWTAVLVMDGTTHRRTREIFEQLNHPKLRKFAMPTNVGPYPTRNKAFELTETPYHFYLDGDDMLLPDCIGLVLDTFAKNPDAGFVYGDYEICRPETPQQVVGVERFPQTFTPEGVIDGAHPPGACAYRKSLWERLGGFAPELARGPADFDFHIGAMELGVHGRHCGKSFYRCRKGHASVTGSYDARTGEIFETMVRRHPIFFRDGKLRRRFLAIGYRRAAYASHMAGDPRRAGQLGWLALRHGMWGNPKLWALVLKGWNARRSALPPPTAAQ